MAAKPVRFHEDADAEYEDAFDWYLARSPHAAAAEFAAELSRAVELIAQAPPRWAPGLGGIRRFLLRRFPLALVYRELPSVIQVLAVAHSHRRPSYWKLAFRRMLKPATRCNRSQNAFALGRSECGLTQIN